MFRIIFIVLHFIFLYSRTRFVILLFVIYISCRFYFISLVFVFLSYFKWARCPIPIQAKAHFICPGLRPKQQAYGRPTGHTLLRPSSFHAFPVRVEFSPAKLSLSPCTCTRPKHHAALIALAQFVEV